MSLRITCGSCNSDFAFSPEEIGEDGVRSKCPFCNASFHVAAGQDGEPEIITFIDQKKNLRVCIECSKEFDGDSQEAIPVCPECKGTKTGPTESQKEEHGLWKVVKDGRVIEIESQATVRELIRLGTVYPDDQIISPTGASSPAKQFVEFRSAFKSSVKRKRQTKQSLTSSSRTVRSPIEPMKAVLLLLTLAFIAASGWAVYRVATFKLPQAFKNSTLTELVRHLKKKHPVDNIELSENDLHVQTQLLIEKDTDQSYEAAQELLEQTLVLNPNSPKTLGWLAETHARKAKYFAHANLRLPAMDLANLAVQVFPDNIDGYLARARVALSANNFTVAKSAAQKAQEIDPTAPRTLLTSAAVILAEGEDSKQSSSVVEKAKTSLEVGGRYLEAYKLLGLGQLGSGKPIEALDAFESRLKQQTATQNLYSGLGISKSEAATMRRPRVGTL